MTLADPQMSSVALQRDTELWFLDGNLVIQAGNKLFRVSPGILGARSSVFGGMLGLPQPDSCETFEGVPFLRLEDDATDVTSFLKAIYDSSFFERPPAKTSYEAVAGILRLSTKYDVQYLRQRAILHLDTLLPSTLEQFSKRNELRTIPPHKDLVFDASLLAREADVLWILPQVLYIISNHPVSRILDGFPWNDSVKEMAEVDRNACIHALKAINITIPNSLMGCFAVGAIDDCQSPTRCPAVRLGIIGTFLEKGGPPILYSSMSHFGRRCHRQVAQSA